MGPDVLHLVLALTVRDDAPAVLLLDLGDFAVGLVEEFGFLLRNHHVVDSDGNARAGGRAETEFLEPVESFNSGLLATDFVATPNDVGELFLAANLIEETEFLRPNLVEDHTARRGFQNGGFGIAVDRLDPFVGIFEKNRRGGANRAFGKGEFDLFGVGKKRTALLLIGVLGTGFLREVVATERNVLRRRGDRLAAGRREDVVRRQHEHAGFHLRLDRERHMDRHLVTIEVRVVSSANERVDADGLALDENRLERLDRETVQGRGAVEHHRVALGDLFENVPNLGRLALDELLRAANGVDIAEFLEAADDERLEQNKRHLLGKTALVELEFRTDDDDRAARVVHALAKEVLAETAAFALEHVAERFQRTVRGTGDGAAMAAVVEERVHRLLEHALFVADDDLGGLELEQRAETVVAVDDATIEIVEIRGRETATFKRHERTKIRRDDGKDIQNHPLRAALRLGEALNELEALGEFFAELLGAGVAHGLFDFLLEIGEVEIGKNLLDRLGAHSGGEALTVLFLGVAEFRLGEELGFLERRVAGVDDNVILVINDALELAARHVEHEAEARGHAFVEPNVRNRHGEVDVAHALAAHAGQRDFHTATVADDALVLDAFVFSAGALPVACGTENAFAEKTALFRLEGAVVDGLRILDLAFAPTAHGVGGRHGDGNLVETDLLGFTKGFAEINFFHVWNGSSVLGGCDQARAASVSPGCLPPTRTSRPRPCISLMSTLKDSGVPASSELSPFTMLS